MLARQRTLSNLQLSPQILCNFTSFDMSLNEVVSPAKVAASLTELWSPWVVAEVDDAYVKVAKVEGPLAWHTHDDEDELLFGPERNPADRDGGPNRRAT